MKSKLPIVFVILVLFFSVGQAQGTITCDEIVDVVLDTEQWLQIDDARIYPHMLVDGKEVEPCGLFTLNPDFKELWKFNSWDKLRGLQNLSKYLNTRNLPFIPKGSPHPNYYPKHTTYFLVSGNNNYSASESLIEERENFPPLSRWLVDDLFYNITHWNYADLKNGQVIEEIIIRDTSEKSINNVSAQFLSSAQFKTDNSPEGQEQQKIKDQERRDRSYLTWAWFLFDDPDTEVTEGKEPTSLGIGE